jgi:DivIVA domain-containing protein
VAEKRTSEQDGSGGLMRTHVPAEIRNASFPVAVRGYERRAVDSYIERVNRVIAELEVTRSPQAAVRHAVERVGEQTKAILDEARESAERIIGTARAEADEIVGKAKAEAAELVVDASTEADRLRGEGEQLMSRTRAEADEIVARAQADAAEHMRQSEEELTRLRESAQARMRDLQADTAGVWNERTELLADIEQLATRLKEAAGAAAARFSPEEPEETPAEEDVAEEPAHEAETEPAAVVASGEQENLEDTLVREGRRKATRRRNA